MNLSSISQNFSDVNAAREFFEKQRWPDGTVCPFCGVVGEAYRLKAKPDSVSPVRPGVWKCKGCRKQFTVTKGTIFEDSHIPLNTWLMAIHLVCASKKGMSAHQLHRMLGVTYKAAWFMVHRLRYAATHDSFASLLSGVVEVDETYIGGKRRRNKRLSQTGKTLDGRAADRISGTADKKAVLSLVERNGEVRSHYVQRVTANNIRPILSKHISESAKIMTDTGSVLHGAIHPRAHYQVNHTQEEYARYERGICVSTNTVEGFFAILKRGITGTYHHVSTQHLHRYLSEFDFRYNTRKITDGERSCKLIVKSGGKRLMYKDVIASHKRG